MTAERTLRATIIFCISHLLLVTLLFVDREARFLTTLLFARVCTKTAI
jgi:hypothetical protein